MTDRKDINKLYEYKLNSNLVIKNKGSRDHRVPTGEAESLRGRVNASQMGDRVARAKPRAKTKKTTDSNSVVMKRRKEPEVMLGSYKPTTRETRSVFEELLALVQRYLGDQPRDIVHGATDEVLAIVKEPEKTAPLKMVEVRKLLGRDLNDAKFAQLLRLCDRINDYTPDNLDEDEEANAEAANGNPAEEDLGVAVVFDDDDDEEGEDDDGPMSEIEEESSSSSDSDNEDTARASSKTNKKSNKNADSSGDDLDPHDVDAYWIQRQLSKYYDDANATQDLAAQVVDILGEIDERACENRLVMLLDFDKFDLIKVLLANRKMILYCTKLKQAQSDAERDEIKKEMENDRTTGGGQDILFILQHRKGAMKKGDVLKQSADHGSRQREDHIKLVDGDEGAIAYPSLDNIDVSTMKRLDIDSLTFSSGDHTMSNKEVKLPKGAWRKQNKSYEEVHVPPLKPRPFGKDEKLIRIDELPPFTRAAFKNMKALNRVQSRIYPTALNEDFNLLVCAPTGAGKTNVAVLTLLHEIGKFAVDPTNSPEIDIKRMKEEMKIVYVAPMKALVQEVVVNFSQRLGRAYGLEVRELSGDQQLTRAEIASTQLIVTTPEKWDIVTRKAGERAYTQLVKLVIIDEIHLLHNERGAVLEAIVARTIRQQEESQRRCRIVGISATLPNYTDVASFLRVPLDTGLFFFDNSFRPVPLQQQYIGLTERKPLKRFQKSNELCYEKITGALKRNPKDQILVFVHSRKETAQTARAIRDLANEREETGMFVDESKPETKELLRDEAEKNVRSSDLKEILVESLAIHHAGMTRSDRNLVEDLFKAGYIKALVCTATLAWGVNLPAHTVIIKGTQVYNPEKGRWTELSQLDILQMLGRAGRPQYDTEGEGIIITTHSELQYYLSLMNEQLPIESQLLRRMADSLNAELVMGTTQTVQDAARWLGYTYLYIRMLKNPKLYGVGVDEVESDPTLLQRRLQLVHSAALLLDKARLIRYDRRTGHMQVTPLGRIASHYYITYDSMQTYNEHLRLTMSDIDLFKLFSLSKEFSDIVVRDEEKVELEQLNERAPIPIKESIEEPSAKVNLLLQSFISGLGLDGFALACDLVFVHQSANRIIRALFEVCLAKNWASLSLRCLNLAIMCEHRLWPSQTFLRQMQNHGLASDVLEKIERHHLSLDQMLELNAQELGELTGGGVKLGKQVYQLVHAFPKIELSAHVQPITRSTLRVELTISPDFEFNAIYYGGSSLLFWVIMEDGDGEEVLHSEMVSIGRNTMDEQVTSFMVTLSDPLPPQYFCKIVCDRFMHSITVLPISFRKLILPERYPPPTELLDMKPLDVSRAVEEGANKVMFKKLFKFKTFNSIQSQVFHSVYSTDDNVLVASPSGSGKTVLAELSIVRCFEQHGKVVYVSPVEEICQARFDEWSRSFDDKLVVRLTGETAADLKRISAGNLIISEPEYFDNISRRWKQRRAVRDISLFICDQLHLVGGSGGPTLEVIVSRMRFISASTQKTRIVGLSSSAANANDLASWIGADKFFNFHPSNRPNPLEVELRGFNINHYGTRLLAMARPTFDHIVHYLNGGGSGGAIVYTGSRRQAKTTAVDLITFGTSLQIQRNNSGVDKKDKLFLDVEVDVSKIQEPSLQQTMEFGVGYLHNSLSVQDKTIVETLYEKGVIKVLVVTCELCWSMSLRAGLVVIMGTSKYDGSVGRYVDYPVTDLMQMMGNARTVDGNDTEVDADEEETAKCVVLCHSKRKPYYKKFLHDPLPVESHLDHMLADHFCAEIVSGVIKNKQEAVDYLTWTLLYRRLTKNPNYYNLLGTSNDMLSDFLSEFVESTLGELEESKCIAVDETDMDISPLNLGMIASYYYLQYSTIEVFAANLKATSKMKRVLDVLTSAVELEVVPVRARESKALEGIAKHLPLPIVNPDYGESRTKAHVLLQMHFSRQTMTLDQKKDLTIILNHGVRLVQAIVDIISSSGWLKPALSAMELSQMIVQARWNTDSPLLQIPHFNQDLVEKCTKLGVKRVYDISELEDKDREGLFSSLTKKQLFEVAEYCNSYPDVEVAADVVASSSIKTGKPVQVTVRLERIDDEDDDEDDDEEEKVTAGSKRKREAEEKQVVYGKVVAPFYPKQKIEGYWVVIGNPETNTLLSIKRITLGKEQIVNLEFDAPKKPGEYQFKLYLMCDSVLGVDQVKNLDIKVLQGEQEDDTSSSSSSDSSSDED